MVFKTRNMDYISNSFNSKETLVPPPPETVEDTGLSPMAVWAKRFGGDVRAEAVQHNVELEKVAAVEEQALLWLKIESYFVDFEGSGNLLETSAIGIDEAASTYDHWSAEKENPAFPNPEPYDPAADGFVFTLAQIEAQVLRHRVTQISYAAANMS